MNKIKAVFDLVKAIQKEESKKGTLNVELKDGGEKVGEAKVDFDLNRETGRGKITHQMETTLGGGKKHSGESEFSMEDCHKHHEGMHFGKMGMHRFHGAHGMEQAGPHGHGRCGHLSKLKVGLALLDSLQVEETSEGNRRYLLDMGKPGETLTELMAEWKEKGCCHKGHERIPERGFGTEAAEGCCGHGAHAHAMKEFVHDMMKTENKEGTLVVETDRTGKPMWAKLDANSKDSNGKEKTILVEWKLR